jgi:hypothetical protein
MQRDWFPLGRITRNLEIFRAGFKDGGRSENDIVKYRRIASLPTGWSDRKTRGAFWGAGSPSGGGVWRSKTKRRHFVHTT